MDDLHEIDCNCFDCQQAGNHYEKPDDFLFLAPLAIKAVDSLIDKGHKKKQQEQAAKAAAEKKAKTEKTIFVIVIALAVSFLIFKLVKK